ncbi:MAG: hypothetical protein ABJB66_05865 [Gemmatimonadaceae bacterium]
MQCSRILVVTGASGAGKTTLVRTLEARSVPGVSFHYFDSIGVPSVEQMVADYGGGAQWQLAMTNQWIERLADNGDGLSVLDAQVRPSACREAFTRMHVDGHIVLIDCRPDVRENRLRELRGQPELVTRDMACWGSYLRGQADALGLPVIDTTLLSVEAAADILHAQVSAHSASL